MVTPFRLIFASVIAIGSTIAASNACAESSKRTMFYPPFITSEVVRRVGEWYDSNDHEQINTMIAVRYGTRAEWTNACAWLESQTEKASGFYKPVQKGVPENEYFCSVFQEYDTFDEEAVVALHELIRDLIDQFGGAEQYWSFSVSDATESEKLNHNASGVAE